MGASACPPIPTTASVTVEPSMGLTRSSKGSTNLMGLGADVMKLDVHGTTAAQHDACIKLQEAQDASSAHRASNPSSGSVRETPGTAEHGDVGCTCQGQAKAAEEVRLAASPTSCFEEAAAAVSKRFQCWVQGLFEPPPPPGRDQPAAEEVRLAAEAEALETARLAAATTAAEEARLAAEAEALETARLAAAAAKEWNQLCVADEVARRAARARDSQRRVRAALARDSARRDRAKQRRSRQRRVQRRATVPEGDEPLELLGNCELVGFGVTAGSTCHVPTFDLLGDWLDAGNCNAPPSPSSPTSCFEEAAAAFSKRFQCWVQGLFD